VIYPRENLRAVKEEFAKDRRLHSELLKGLTKEVRERRYSGKRFYLCALNCMLFDAFARCSIPPPPLPQWNLKVDPKMTRKEVYHRQLIAWDAYKCRVFALIATVVDNPMGEEEEEEAPIVPVPHRGEMVPMKDRCFNEERAIDFGIEQTRERKADNKEPNTANKAENNNAGSEKDGKDDWSGPACGCVECKEKFLDARAAAVREPTQEE